MSSRQQLKQLQLALINAFPSRALLERLLYFELEKNLNEITRESDLQETVFKLIQTAESQGWLVELVRAARKENPGNSELEAIALELLPPEPPIQSQQKISGNGNGDVVIVNRDYSPIKYDNSNQFDVFLAHNSQDKLQVRKIAQELKRRGLKPWLDEEQIPPGRPFQDEIQRAIPLVKSAAIFLGLQGLGRWQVMELRSLISMCVEKNIPVILVLLPSMNKIPENLSFLREFHYVSFPERIDDENALYLLEWGITGLKPEPTVKVIPQPSNDLNTPKSPTQTQNIWLSNEGYDVADDLSSDRFMDYTRLRDLLAAGNWKLADKETFAVMLQATDREKLGWLSSESINNFSCTDLRTIDQLWAKYSKGRFGFSVQKRIWESVGGDYEKFGDRVGWRMNKQWITDDMATFDTSAPTGHLPTRVFGVFEGVVCRDSSLASRLVKCKQ